MKHIIIDFKESFLISLRAIRDNKMRSALTTLGIVIGIVAVTTMSTAIVGLHDAFLNSISSFGSDVLYVDKFPWFATGDFHMYRNRKDITYEQYEKLKKVLPNFTAIAPNLRTFGSNIKYKSKSVQATLVYGTTEDFIKTSKVSPQEGRFLSSLDVKAARRVCIVGQDISNGLFPGQDAINKTIRINNITFRIIGILEKQGSFLGSFSLDGQVIMPFKTFERVIGQARNRMRIDVQAPDPNKMEDAKEQVTAAMRVIRKNPPGTPDDFAINQQEVFQQVYDKTVGIISIAGIVVTALSLFVGAIGIMNIMFVSVTERTKEIGIRKAIGAKTWSILGQFLIEAAVICIFGGIIGLIISFPLSLIIDQFLPTAMPLNIVLLSLLISALVGLVSGFLPAYKASKLNPVDALRYE